MNCNDPLMNIVLILFVKLYIKLKDSASSRDSSVHLYFVLVCSIAPLQGRPDSYRGMSHQGCTQSSRRVGMEHAGVQVWAWEMGVIVGLMLNPFYTMIARNSDNFFWRILVKERPRTGNKWILLNYSLIYFHP